MALVRPRRRAALLAWRRHAVERMRRSRQATLALLESLPASAIRRPRTQGAWSVQDVLVHIAAWEEEGARRLELIRRGRGDRILFYETAAEADAFNARAVSSARRASLSRVRARLAQARTRLITVLRRLPPGSLADPTHALPVRVWLREFAWKHEQAHRRDVRAWWRAQRRPFGAAR